MGKRKASKRKPIDRDPEKKKAAKTLATTFPCLFCNSEKSVMARMDKKAGVADLSCNVCDQRFQTRINYLSAAVDAYADWVDACDAVAKAAADSPADPPADSPADSPADDDTGIASFLDDDDGIASFLDDDDLGDY